MSLISADAKVKEICEILRKETLDPAIAEAKRIVEAAKEEAHLLIHKAREEVQKIKEESKKELQKQLSIQEASLELAINQALSILREKIESLFNLEFQKSLTQVTQNIDVMRQMIEVIIKAIEKEGLSTNIQLLVPHTISPEDILKSLNENIKQRLNRENIQLTSDFQGGIELKLIDHQFSIQLSDQSIRELIAPSVTEEVRSKLFRKS